MSTYDELEAAAQRAYLPWDVSLELTHRCNERCAMCYLGPDWGKGRKGDELTTAEIFRVLDDLHAAGCFNLLLTGGEVCLRKDLVEILDYAGSLGFLIKLKTNGTMVTEELVQAVQRNPVQWVDMSLLGSTAEVHDAVTKIPGSFDKTIHGIKMFRAVDQQIKLNFTAMTLNFRDISAANKLANDLGCTFEWSAQVQPRDDRSVIPLTLRLGKDDMKTVQTQKVAELRAENGGEVPLSEYQTEGWFCGAGKVLVEHHTVR